MKLETMVLGPLATNCYILWDEQTMEAAVIDPGADSNLILDYIERCHFHVRAILLTHGHFDHCMGLEEDHIGGLKVLHERTGAPVYVSKADSTDPAEMTHGRLIFTNTYEDGDELTLGHIRIRVIATPGHTPGGVCLLAGDWLFSGDTLFAGSCGRTDFKGGDQRAMMESLRRLGQLPGNLRVLPGHMEESTLDAERQWNPWMREALKA